jgi:hypothetical protein
MNLKPLKSRKTTTKTSKLQSTIKSIYVARIIDRGSTYSSSSSLVREERNRMKERMNGWLI